jgi:hypothetical protein
MSPFTWARISSTLMVFGFSWDTRMMSGWFPDRACLQEWHSWQGSSPPLSHCSAMANTLAMNSFPEDFSPLMM